MKIFLLSLLLVATAVAQVKEAQRELDVAELQFQMEVVNHPEYKRKFAHLKEIEDAIEQARKDGDQAALLQYATDGIRARRELRELTDRLKNESPFLQSKREVLKKAIQKEKEVKAKLLKEYETAFEDNYRSILGMKTSNRIIPNIMLMKSNARDNPLQRVGFLCISEARDRPKLPSHTWGRCSFVYLDHNENLALLDLYYRHNDRDIAKMHDIIAISGEPLFIKIFHDGLVIRDYAFLKNNEEWGPWKSEVENVRLNFLGR